MKVGCEVIPRLKPCVRNLLSTHGFIRGAALKYLLFSLIFLCSKPTFGQVGIHFDKIEWDKKENEILLSFGSFPSFIFTKSLTQKITSKLTPPAIPNIYAYQDLALFCKVEVKIEKALKRNFKFRLGTLDYVNRLERKY